MLKKALMATAIAFAAASAQADTVILSQMFDNVPTLTTSGWVLSNQSSALGSTGWYQGVDSIFAAQSGAPGSYIAANFNNAAPGGTIANYLISPSFSTAVSGVVKFWAKADISESYYDTIAFGLSSGTGSTPPFALAPATTLTGDWTQYSVSFTGTGASTSSRFVIDYIGSFDTSNYIGIDTFSVSTLTAPVPEPETWVLMGAGILGLALRARRIAKRVPA